MTFMLTLLGFFSVAGALLVIIVGTMWIVNLEVTEMTGINFARLWVKKHYERIHRSVK